MKNHRTLLTLLLTLPLLASCRDQYAVTCETSIDEGGILTRRTALSYQGESSTNKIEQIFRAPEGVKVLEQSNTALRFSFEAARPEDAPRDIALKGRGGALEAGNELRWSRRDHALFVLTSYREELRDSTDPAQRDAAIERLYRLIRAVAVALLQESGLGKEATAPFLAELDGPIRSLFGDLVRILCAEKNEERRALRITERMATTELPLAAEKGINDLDQAVLKHLAARLESLIKTEPGQPPFDATRVIAKSEEGRRSLVGNLDAALLKVHGSAEAASKAFAAAFDDITGTIDKSAISFQMRVTMPGRILRTNGVLESPDERGRARVLWLFDETAVARNGHTIEVESITISSPALARIPGAAAELSSAQILAIMALLEKRDEATLGALAKAFESPWEADAPPGRDALPEELRSVFDEMVEIARRPKT